MNNYPSWWNETVTVYNKFIDPTTNAITWTKKTITGCFIKYIGNKELVNDTVIETNSIICRIRKSPLFKERYEWEQLSASERLNYFTLGKDDIIVKGEVTDDVNEYVSGSRSTDLISKYKRLQGCLIVTKYTINIGGGRCNEHYLAKGI